MCFGWMLWMCMFYFWNLLCLGGGWISYFVVVMIFLLCIWMSLIE